MIQIFNVTGDDRILRRRRQQMFNIVDDKDDHGDEQMMIANGQSVIQLFDNPNLQSWRKWKGTLSEQRP